MIRVESECDPGCELGWEAGILWADLARSEELRPYSRNSRDVSDLRVFKFSLALSASDFVIRGFPLR